MKKQNQNQQYVFNPTASYMVVVVGNIKKDKLSASTKIEADASYPYFTKPGQYFIDKECRTAIEYLDKNPDNLPNTTYQIFNVENMAKEIYSANPTQHKRQGLADEFQQPLKSKTEITELREQNSALLEQIKNLTATIEQLRTAQVPDVTGLQSQLSEKDNYIKELHNSQTNNFKEIQAQIEQIYEGHRLEVAAKDEEIQELIAENQELKSQLLKLEAIKETEDRFEKELDEIEKKQSLKGLEIESASQQNIANMINGVINNLPAIQNFLGALGLIKNQPQVQAQPQIQTQQQTQQEQASQAIEV